jgi:multisubunit Na+/H+ antiporter MnhE subunit
MLLGLTILWLLLTQLWNTPSELSTAVMVGFVCTWFAARFFRIQDGYLRAPQTLSLVARRWTTIASASASTVLSAIAADVMLKPALVRLKSRAHSPPGSLFTHLMSATPGVVVVDADQEGLLVHVNNEDRVDLETAARADRGSRP